MVERETSARNKQVLKKLLAEPGNKTCADCKTATHPRWASWNLGIFLCIRCSGIHRSLGTHISKVRSVDLDSWTEMHLHELIRWGNRRANLYWEAKLPPNYVPDESKIVNYVKTKYDLRRWVASSQVPDPATIDSQSEDVPLSEVRSEVRPVVPPKPVGRASAAPAAQPASAIDLLGDFGAISRAPPARATAATPARAAPGSLLDFDESVAPAARTQATPLQKAHTAPATRQAGAPAPQAAARGAPASSRPMDDLFGAPQVAPKAASATPPPTQSSAAAGRADLKKSILSLYAQRPSPSPAPVAPVASAPAAPAAAQATAPATSPAARPAASNDLFDLSSWSTPAPASSAKSGPAATGSSGTDLTSSLAGLSFGAPRPASQPAPPSYGNPLQAAAGAPTPVAASAAPSEATTSSNGGGLVAAIEEDDVFANVWK